MTPSEQRASDPVRLERNLRLYGWYFPLARSYFWAPVFFLYFSERFPIDQVLALQSLYYFTVVALEVPSGYLSDRVSRTVTLQLSALAAVASYTLFYFGGASFGSFAAAQVFIAVSFSFASGTDASFHYDSLAALGREREYADREARLGGRALFAGSACALAGGAAGMIELRVAYGLSLVVAVLLLPIVLAMREPPRYGEAAPGFLRQLGSCLGQLRTPVLAWLFVYVILQTSLEHVPYEFAQPYVATVLGESATRVQNTPLAMGAVSAGIAFVAAFAARASVRLRDRLGFARALLGVTALQTVVITLMGLVVHALVIPLILLRSVYPAISRVLVNAEVAPRIPQLQRATYFSIHSLAGRLGYAAVLFVLSRIGAGEANDPQTVATMLHFCTALAVAGWLVLTLSRGALRSIGAVK